MSDEKDPVEPEITGDESVNKEDNTGDEKAEKVSTKDLQREIALLKNELDLQGKKHEYLAKQHQADRKPAPKVEDTELDIDLVEAVTNNDRKGLAAAILKIVKKEGFVSRDEVDKRVEQRASEFGEQQRILTEYPDLGKRDSAFFKATQDELTRLDDDPEYAKLSDGKRISMAAERAQLALYRAGKGVESEDSRQTRIRAQAGKVGGGGAKDRPESEEMTPEQKRISRLMGVADDAYKKRAKAGVNIGGHGNLQGGGFRE